MKKFCRTMAIVMAIMLVSLGSAEMAAKIQGKSEVDYAKVCFYMLVCVTTVYISDREERRTP